MGKKKPAATSNVQYEFYVGESKRNPSFPRNTQKTSSLAYIFLIFNVLFKEIMTFYSLYFIIVGILELFPGISTTQWWATLIPLLIVFVLEYLVQAKGLYNAQIANGKDDARFYTVTRDHLKSEKRSKSIKPGDLIEICDQATVPCDCILLNTEQSSIFINTSKIDGETDVKDRIPIRTPPSFHNNEYIRGLNAKVTATPAQSRSREVSGQISFHSNQPFDFESDDNNIIDSSEPGCGYRQDIDGSITCTFDTNSFIERGSLIETDGNHLLLALYTGKYCRSDATIATTATGKTLIDDYLEKISMFIFIFQLLISAVFGYLGYDQVRKQCKYYEHLENYSYYIPLSLLHCTDIKAWMFLVIFVRNFLMLSFMVPITLKILLPIFRFIYGVFFISQDLNFIDPDTGNKADVVSTNITENLGALNVIVSDKTGTLTKNKLTLVSLVVGDTKYGDSRKAPTIIEDVNLRDQLTNSSEEFFVLTFQALSVCHTIKISENNQEFHGSSQDELAILTALQKLGWKWHENHDMRTYESPLGNYVFKILKVNTFDRKRMRMSVVVQMGDSIYCFMKGASERVIRSCGEKSGDLATNYDMYQKKGLRTMSVSFKKIEGKFGPDTPIEELEEEHTLLATLGIEDALQNDVQLTLDILSDAGLKIWVATGDAKMNTLVVSSMLHLLRSNEPIVHLDINTLRSEAGLPVSPRNDEIVPVGFSTKAMLVAENSFSTVINAEDDEVLRYALLKKDFLNALYRSRCVIFYRCKPITKSDIAISLQNAGKRVLGIGDGYNDTLLLKTSDVGVGIIAPDGSKAFATCDFAIPAFRSLGRLILIHGHQALHRSVLAVHFSFYKAVMFAVCQSTYQIWTQFSGQSLFDSFAMFCFNNIWTLLPIISLLFEKDIGESFLYRLSYLYDKLRNPLTITASNLTWFFVAVYQGSIIVLISWALTGEAFLSPEGKDFGAPYLSLILYISMVLISSFYMLYQTNTFTYYSMVLICGNIMLLIASSALLQSSGTVFGQLIAGNWIGFYGECFNNTTTLIIILTIVLAAVSPSWLALTIWSEFRNSDSLRIIETETIAAKNDTPLFFDPPKDN